MFASRRASEGTHYKPSSKRKSSKTQGDKKFRSTITSYIQSKLKQLDKTNDKSCHENPVKVVNTLSMNHLKSSNSRPQPVKLDK